MCIHLVLLRESWDSPTDIHWNRKSCCCLDLCSPIALRFPVLSTRVNFCCPGPVVSLDLFWVLTFFSLLVLSPSLNQSSTFECSSWTFLLCRRTKVLAVTSFIGHSASLIWGSRAEDLTVCVCVSGGGPVWGVLQQCVGPILKTVFVDCYKYYLLVNLVNLE